MFWWFERRGELLRLEVLQLSAQAFELRVIRDDGSESIETFADARQLARRQSQLQHEVTKDGWMGPRGPIGA